MVESVRTAVTAGTEIVKDVYTATLMGVLLNSKNTTM